MKIGVSLGAGGARGYAHIGVLKALEEAGIKPDLLNGSSMGAIIAGGYALYGQAAALEGLAHQVFSHTKLRYFNFFQHEQSPRRFLENWFIRATCDVSALRLSLFSHRRNQEVLRFIFGEKTFAETQIPFWAVAVDLLRGDVVSIHDGPLWKGILASISIPGIFPPVEWEGRLLADGGILAEVPVRELRAQGADFVIGVRVKGDEIGESDPLPSHGFSLLTRLDMWKGEELARWELSAADFVLEIDLSGVDVLRFDVFEETIAAGYRRAKACLPALKEALGAR